MGRDRAQGDLTEYIVLRLGEALMSVIETAGLVLAAVAAFAWLCGIAAPFLLDSGTAERMRRKGVLRD